jgi:hypothetical protein
MGKGHAICELFLSARFPEAAMAAYLLLASRESNLRVEYDD